VLQGGACPRPASAADGRVWSHYHFRMDEWKYNATMRPNPSKQLLSRPAAGGAQEDVRVRELEAAKAAAVRRGAWGPTPSAVF
jgi:hypothetical protein